MTFRERFLAIMSGDLPDKMLWIPRILLWYRAAIARGTMPYEWRGLSLRELERKLGVGAAARDGKIFEKRYDGVEIENADEDGKSVTFFHTPKGTVRTTTHHTEELARDNLPQRVQEYPLQREEDYGVWEYIVERTTWVPCFDEYRSYDDEIGEEGLPMVGVGDVPFHDFMLNLTGYNHGFYHMADYPQKVDHLLNLMREVQRERLWPVILDSPAQLVLHGVHLSSMFTPPPLYEKYILPYYKEFIPLLHEKGKKVAMHADNDTSLILELLEKSGYDVLECFVTSPMVPLTLKEARKKLGDRVILWGCIPSAILSPSYSDREFREYVKDVFNTIAPGKAVILGVADNVMPDSDIRRIEWVSEFIENHGSCPIAPM